MEPIFIGGCGRSGTTLLGAMLGAHSRVVTQPETQFLLRIWRRLAEGSLPPDLEGLLATLAGMELFKAWGVALAPPPAGFVPEGKPFPDLVRYLVGKFAESRGFAGRDFWVDHTPWNLRFAPFLREAFPHARFVHILRDGRAVAASVLKVPWGPASVKEAAGWWAQNLGAALAAEAALPAASVTRVRFEDLVSRPEEELERLAGFLGLDFEPAMLKADGFKILPASRVQHALVGQPPQPGRAESWRKELTPRQIEVFEHYDAGLLALLGYPLQFGLAARLTDDRPPRPTGWRRLWKGAGKLLTGRE